jgi:hypothetical protein
MLKPLLYIVFSSVLLTTNTEGKYIVKFEEIKYLDTSWLGSDIIIRESKKIRVEFSVQAINQDSIIAHVTFFNDSTDDICLYKPILPMGLLSQNNFDFTDATNSIKVNFKDNINTIEKYHYGSSLFMGAIKPNLKANNIILLRANKKLTFRVNVAKHYDFKSTFSNGFKDFVGGYYILMPYIKNGKQIFDEDEFGNPNKPVYLSLTSVSAVDNRDYKYVRFTIPK